MKMILFSLLTVVFAACASTSPTANRVPAQNQEMIGNTNIVGASVAIRKITYDPANISSGDITIDLGVCPEVRLTGSGAPDVCILNFTNVFLFLNPTKYHYSMKDGATQLSIDIDNQRIHMDFWSQQLSREEILARIQKLLSGFSNGQPHLSVQGTKLTLKNVKYITL